MRAGSVLKTDDLLFLVSIIAGVGVLSNQLIRKFEEKVSRWRFERSV
jgi:ABC-type nitrate/sulfonate/bicarbonate transport system permease component